MPALPDVAKVLKVAMIWSDGVNTDIVTRFYISYGGSAPSSAELDTFCDSVRAGYTADLNPVVNDNITLGRVHAIDLSSPTGAEGNWSGSVTGAGTNPPNALDVAMVISYEIDRRYRGGHPRGYWPVGDSSVLQTPQTWTSGFVSGVQGGIEAFFTAVLAAGWSGAGALEHVNVSYFAGFTVVTNPTTHRARNVPTVRATPLVDAVGSYIARVHLGTQRRRLQY